MLAYEKIKKIIRPYINYRKIRLLGFIDTIEFVKQSIKTRKQNLGFLSKYKNYPVPPKHLSFDAYGHINWQIYHDMGQNHAKYIAQLVQENITNDNLKICEWGCGPARIVRHLSEYLAMEHLDVFGVDYNKKTIDWCAETIPGVTFLLNSLAPPLSFKEEFLDCIYSISVFTHLSEVMHYEWIRELKRVIKKNGVIILSTQGDQFKSLLKSSEKQKYEAGQLVIRGNVREGKKFFSAFHPVEFMHELFLQADLELVKHITNPELQGFNQDIWILRK